MKNKIAMFACAVMLFITAYANPVFADYYSDNTTLYVGMNNAEVVNVQNDLKSLGFYNYPTSTGYFGSITKQAVIDFQQSYGLSADGIVGPNTAKGIKAQKVIKTAKQYLGVPYVWGGTSPSGFDCSGFVHYTLLQNDIIVPRTAALQYEKGIAVSKSNLRPGDLVFFTTYAPGASHVGIYLGNNQFIHGSSGAGKVIISDLNNSYYSQHYIGARRMI